MTTRSVHASLHSLAVERDNDYSPLELAYRSATGGELVCDPFRSSRFAPPPASATPSASVVVPAWNARETLGVCIAAIEHSSFNQRYPDKLEVVVVDDGSTDGTWELLEGLAPRVRLVAARQKHHSRAHAQNTAIALAAGEVVISCDADMVLSLFAIEELVKRHQVLGKVMLLGFRGDIDPRDGRISPTGLGVSLPRLPPPYRSDVRVTYPIAAWPESMCRDTHHLKRLGAGKSIVMPDGARWDLPGMVYGALFSLSREAFASMDGYDERFVGWGCEDTLVGVRALAMGHHLVPVYSAAGHHIAHADRSPTKWQEFAANRRIYHQLLTQPYSVGEGHYLSRARDRIEAHIERRPLPAEGMADLQTAQAVLDGELEDPHCYGKYLHSLGRYAEAAAAFARIVGSSDVLGWAAFDRGKALRAADRPREAIPHLQQAAGRLPDSAWPLVELAFAHAAASDFGAARRALDAARILAPANPSLVYLLGRGAQHHAQRGALYLRQGDFALARRDYEAALMLNPDDVSALLGRATALVALEQTGPAKLTLDRIARLRPDTPGLAEQRSALAQVVDRTRPLPHARSIAERTQSIPGWFGADEAELLIALVLRAAATSDREPVVLTEIGAYCGRATLTMALTLRALEVRPTSRSSAALLGRADARVLAVAEPTLGPAPDGRPPFHVLREELARFHVRDLVVCAPDEEPEPWRHRCRLLLVDGRHDRRGIEDDLERFLPALASDGLLVFHDYAHYFPDVERTVQELLVDSRFAFVAHVGSLIALSRTALTP